MQSIEIEIIERIEMTDIQKKACGRINLFSSDLCYFLDQKMEHIGFVLTEETCGSLDKLLELTEDDYVDLIDSKNRSAFSKFKLPDNYKLNDEKYVPVFKITSLFTKLFVHSNNILCNTLLQIIRPISLAENLISEKDIPLSLVLNLVNNRNFDQLNLLAGCISKDLFKNILNRNYDPPLLWWAVKSNDLEMVAFLLTSGVNPDIPLSVFSTLTPLGYAVHNDNVQLVNLLKEYTHVDKIIDDELGFTPLHIACRRKNLPMVEALLDGGADANLENKNGHKPYDYATPECKDILNAHNLRDHIGFRKYKEQDKNNKNKIKSNDKQIIQKHNDKIPIIPQYPASYSKMWCAVSIKDKSTQPNFNCVVKLLADYSKTTIRPGYKVSDNRIVKFATLFFTRHIRRTHTSTVHNVLKNYKPTGKPSVIDLLENLKTSLINKGVPIKQDGSLARRINFIQIMTKTKVINISDINRHIEKNKSAIKYRV